MTRTSVCTLFVALLGLSYSPLTSADDLRSGAPSLPAKMLVMDPHLLPQVNPLIVSGAAPDTPAAHVNTNTSSSPFAGVGSLFIDAAPIGDGSGFLCSGCAIHGFTVGKKVVRDYILSAAHCLDFAGGIDEGGNATGDGIPDVAPSQVTFVLNAGTNMSQLITATEIHLHPDWHGFDNVNGPEGASIDDDVALIRLSQPVAFNVPTYNLLTTASSPEVITAVGYGTTGTPSGYIAGSASFTTKRVGLNQSDALFSDDELTPALEVFAADFDGPDGTTNQFDLDNNPAFNAFLEGTLGNEFESTIGPGDSGSPSFLSDFLTGALILGADGKPIVYGVNTFTTADSPAYGSILGGTLVPGYANWINSQMVPEPATWLLAVCGLFAPLALMRRRRA